MAGLHRGSWREFLAPSWRRPGAVGARARDSIAGPRRRAAARRLQRGHGFRPSLRQRLGTARAGRCQGARRRDHRGHPVPLAGDAIEPRPGARRRHAGRGVARRDPGRARARPHRHGEAACLDSRKLGRRRRAGVGTGLAPVVCELPRRASADRSRCRRGACRRARDRHRARNTSGRREWTDLVADTRKAFPGTLVYMAHNAEEAEAIPFWPLLEPDRGHALPTVRRRRRSRPPPGGDEPDGGSARRAGGTRRQIRRGGRSRLALGARARPPSRGKAPRNAPPRRPRNCRPTCWKIGSRRSTGRRSRAC